MLPQASHMVIIVNFIVHFADGSYGKLMENMVSFIINIFKLMETAICLHKLSICLKYSLKAQFWEQTLRKPYGKHG